MFFGDCGAYKVAIDALKRQLTESRAQTKKAEEMVASERSSTIKERDLKKESEKELKRERDTSKTDRRTASLAAGEAATKLKGAEDRRKAAEKHRARYKAAHDHLARDERRQQFGGQRDLYEKYWKHKFDESHKMEEAKATVNAHHLIQKELLSIQRAKELVLEKDLQNVVTDITMNERIMDYDLSDSGTNERLQKLMYVITLVLIFATICILFLKRFSLM